MDGLRRVEDDCIRDIVIAVFGVGLVVIVNAREPWQVLLFAACVGIGYAVNFYFLAAWCFCGAIVLFFMRPPEALIHSS